MRALLATRSLLVAVVGLASCSTREPRSNDPPAETAVCAQSVTKVEDDSWLDSGPFPRALFLSASGCPACKVLNIAPLQLPYTGVAAASAKVRTPDGIYKVLTLDSANKLVNAKDLIAAEETARTARHGKFSPALDEWLASAAPTDQKWIAVWTNVVPRSVAKTAALKDPSAAAALSAAVAADVEAQVSPVRAWLKARVPTAEFGDSSGPMLRVRLTTPVIRELAKLPQVAALSVDGYPGKPSSPPWSTVSQWGETIHVPDAHLFATGSGARVCIKEQYRHDDPYAKLEIAETAYPSGTSDSHARMSAAIVRNKDATAAPWRSVAPSASIYMANWTGYTGSGGVDQWCRDRYVKTLNYGHYLSTAPGGLTATDRAHDWLAKNSPYTLVVGSAGYVDYTWDTVGNRGYNGIVVGGVHDGNSADPSDNVADTSVAWRNPSISYYNDFELPHVVGPTNGVAVGGSEFGGGPSAATAMVSGIAAAVESRNSWFGSWPEAKRAVIIATATGVTDEGVLTRLPSPSGDRKTGAGVIDAGQAVLLARSEFYASPTSTQEMGHFADTVYFNSSYFDANDYMISKWKTKATKSGRLRVALVWDATATCSGAGGPCSSDVPDSDLDLHLFKKTGDSSWDTPIVPDCYSTTYESTWEMCDIPVDANDEYMIAVRRYGANAASTYLGLAWFHYQLPSGAPCALSSECASGTCASGKCTCSSDADCPDRFCSVSGTCVSRTPCGADTQPCCSSTTIAQPQCNPGLQCVSGTCSTCSGCAPEPVRIYPTKPTFKQSEAISLRVFLPNNTTAPCSLSSNGLGVLTVESLTRGGAAVIPETTTASFIDGFYSARDRSLITTPYGKTWASFNWISERATWTTPPNALSTTTSNGFSGGDVARFSVGEVGDYVAKIRYNHGPFAPSGLCAIAPQVVTVNFTVVGG